MLMRICLGCSKAIPAGGSSRCATCDQQHRRRRDQRKNARPAAKFYATPAWRKTRRRVLARDGCCQRCGTTLNLTVHHIDGYQDPLDERGLEVLCLRCQARRAEASNARAEHNQNSRCHGGHQGIVNTVEL